MKCVSQPHKDSTALQRFLPPAHFFKGCSPNSWREIVLGIFSLFFIFQVPAANICHNCHRLTPKDGRLRCPSINVPQENNSFCQACIGYESLQLPGISFNQLYCFWAHFTKPSGFANINARTMKNPTFLSWPSMGCNPLQSAFSSQGSDVEIACSDFLIVQTSKEPHHPGDKRSPLKAPCKRKYLFTHTVSTHVNLCSMVGGLRR